MSAVGVTLFRTYGAIFIFSGGGGTTAADSYGALAVAWILPAADAACLIGFNPTIADGH